MPNASPNQPHLLDMKYQCILGPGSPLTMFHFEGAAYLLIVDYASRFSTIVHKLTSMTGIHVANQCKSVFSENGWPDTLISDNGPCHILQAFTSVMQAFSVNHITSSLHYPQWNGLTEKYGKIIKCLFNKTKEEGKYFYKCLMINHNTPLTGSLQSPMQILQERSARSDLPLSNAARNQLGIQPEVLRNIDKHETVPYTWFTCRSKCYVSRQCD